MAEYPDAASRDATDRMWGVRPRFSWITTTAPLASVAGAHAPVKGVARPLG